MTTITTTTDMEKADNSATDLLEKINAQDNNTNTAAQTITATLEGRCCGVWKNVGSVAGTIQNGKFSIELLDEDLYVYVDGGFRISGEVR